MTLTRTEPATATRRFVLRPNAGLHWRETVIVFVFLAVVCLGLGVAFAAAGYWLILPFAGIEVVAFGAALYVSARRGAYQEVISVTDERVTIEKGRRAPEQRWEFDRTWSEVELMPAAHRWYADRLLIRSGGQAVECGAFLTDDERTSLARQLLECIGPMESGHQPVKPGRA